MPQILGKGGCVAAMDHHMIQHPAHKSRQLANGFSRRRDRFQRPLLGLEIRVRPDPDGRAVGLLRGIDEIVFHPQLVRALVRHFGLVSPLKDKIDKGAVVRGGDVFMIVRYRRIGIERLAKSRRGVG